MTAWRSAIRKAAVYALNERQRWAHATVDEHCIARAIAYQDMAGRLIRAIDEQDAAAPAPTTAPTEALPAGTPVLAFRDYRDGRALVTHTSGPVHNHHGIAVVRVAGHDGPIALTHIEVLPGGDT